MADKKTHSEENFFQRLISMFLGNSDPEAEKKRLLKSIAKELSRSKYKFYKFSSDEALPQLAKLFYDIYKIIAPAQAMIQGIQNPNAIKNAVINFTLTEKQHELASQLTEEAIMEQSQKVPLNQLCEQVKTNLSNFITDFDTENSTFTISFDKRKIHVPQILAAVMEVSEVTDIKLQETELAEIVKQVILYLL